MWLISWIPWCFLAALCESCGQICFKKAAVCTRHETGLAYYLCLAKNRHIYLGIAANLGEMAVWLYLISHLPLSVAYPLSGLQEMILILFAAVVLKEKIAPLAWAGVFLIAVGVSLVS